MKLLLASVGFLWLQTVSDINFGNPIGYVSAIRLDSGARLQLESHCKESHEDQTSLLPQKCDSCPNEQF